MWYNGDKKPQGLTPKRSRLLLLNCKHPMDYITWHQELAQLSVFGQVLVKHYENSQDGASMDDTMAQPLLWTLCSNHWYVRRVGHKGSWIYRTLSTLFVLLCLRKTVVWKDILLVLVNAKKPMSMFDSMKQGSNLEYIDMLTLLYPFWLPLHSKLFLILEWM